MVKLITSVQEIPSQGVVVIDFFATWCGPCKKVAPMYEEMAKVYSSVTFLKVDVDESNEVAEMFDVRAMPTFVILKDGQRKGDVEGADLRRVAEYVESVMK